MKILNALLCLWLMISCGSAPENDYIVGAELEEEYSATITIGNSADVIAVPEPILLPDNKPIETTQNEPTEEDKETQDRSEKTDGTELSILLASNLYDSRGGITKVNNIFHQAKYAVIASFSQNCLLCENAAIKIENSQLSQQLLSSQKCELSFVFDDFGGENNVLESIDQNLPNFVAGRSYVRGDNFIELEHFGPLFLVVNKSGEIVQEMKTLRSVENFCRQ